MVGISLHGHSSKLILAGLWLFLAVLHRGASDTERGYVGYGRRSYRKQLRQRLKRADYWGYDEEIIAKLNKLKQLTANAIQKREATSHSYEFLKSKFLQHILKPRVPDTASHTKVRNYIVETLERYKWQVHLDTFEEDTPKGKKQFTNIVAIISPKTAKKLMLSAHYDSKDMQSKDGTQFVAASDSAVSVAMLLDIARMVGPHKKKLDNAGLSPMLVFFDGEEAFKSWSNKDSLYGSRHLAAKMAKDNDMGVRLKDLEGMVLLDLIGGKDPTFVDWYPQTTRMYGHLQKIEAKLGEEGTVPFNANEPFFVGKPNPFELQQAGDKPPSPEDDHKPFWKKGVPILHLIATPYPEVWHTLLDNEANLDKPSIEKFLLIFRKFVQEHFKLY